MLLFITENKLSTSSENTVHECKNRYDHDYWQGIIQYICFRFRDQICKIIQTPKHINCIFIHFLDVTYLSTPKFAETSCLKHHVWNIIFDSSEKLNMKYYWYIPTPSSSPHLSSRNSIAERRILIVKVKAWS